MNIEAAKRISQNNHNRFNTQKWSDAAQGLSLRKNLPALIRRFASASDMGNTDKLVEALVTLVDYILAGEGERIIAHQQSVAGMALVQLARRNNVVIDTSEDCVIETPQAGSARFSMPTYFEGSVDATISRSRKFWSAADRGTFGVIYGRNRPELNGSFERMTAFYMLADRRCTFSK